MPDLPAARTYTDYSQFHINDLMKDYYARLLSGLNPDGTPYTMPVNITADIPDFTAAVRAALNQQTAATNAMSSAVQSTLSDQEQALQNLASSTSAAANAAQVAGAQAALAVQQAAQTQVAAQQNVLAKISDQLDEFLIATSRNTMLLVQLVGEEVSSADADAYRISNT